MPLTRHVQLAIVIVLAACAPVPAPPYPSEGPADPLLSRLAAPPDAFTAQLLALHNDERRRAGVAPLGWDPLLASGAAAYAAELSRVGRLRHSPQASRPGQGENLWMGTLGAYSVERMVGGWLGERSLFRPGIFPNVSSNGNWAAVGHYTQIIWRGTTNVGCALGRSGRDDYLVCRYAPAGNVIGQPVP